jgi:ABC-type oligopeptide transport system substrate-binding subunit
MVSQTCQSNYEKKDYYYKRTKISIEKMTRMRKILFLCRLYAQKSFLCGCLLFALGCNQSPKTANQVRSRLSADPERLSPFLSVDAVTQQLLSNLFQKLTDFDPVSLERKAVLVKNVPDLVRVDTGRWKGGISLTYELKDSARWDNGTPITANDYVFSLKIILNPYVNASVWRGYLENLLGDVQLYPENPRKWTVFLRRPYINAESSVGDIFILPVAFYDSNKMLEKYSLSLIHI